MPCSIKPGGFMTLGTPDDRWLPCLPGAAERRGDNTVLNARTLQSLTPLEHASLFNQSALRLVGERVGFRPMQLPLFKWMGAGQLWNKARQINRNLVTPLKRWHMRGPCLWLQKSAV